MNPGATVEATMGEDYRPRQGATRRRAHPRRLHHRHTEKHRRDMWDVWAAAFALSCLLLVVAMLVLRRILLRI
jgi:hypothetical protein